MPPQYFPSAPLGDRPLPFSEAVQLGDTLYVSGQLGHLPGQAVLADGGIAGETRQMMENLRAVLQRHGTDLRHLIKCTVFLADMTEWAAFNKVYLTYFPDHLPARSALGASGLALGARVEMEAIAYVASASCQ